jgi:hypothetical protein
MLSIQVISGSAAMSALLAHSTDWVNDLGLEASSLMAGACVASDREGVVTVMAGVVEAERDDHFHPGTSVCSSRRERIAFESKEHDSFGRGSSSSVIEKPGMFKLVCKQKSTFLR